MKSNIEAIKKIAHDFLIKNNIAHVAIMEPRFCKQNDVDNDLKIDYWSVAYEYKVFQDEVAFIIIADGTNKIIHVINKHGYSYINGEKEAEVVDDDDEDWSDL